MSADRGLAGSFIAPTCDHPGCAEKAVGKVGFDWHCRSHRPSARPLALVVPAIIADVPTPKAERAPTVKEQSERRIDRRKRTSRPHNPTIHKPLPLVLRENAGEHPDLCRIAGCVARLVARGMCDPHGRRARAAGLMDALGLPNKQGENGHNREPWRVVRQ
jgi:hypothetical protein